MSHVYNCYITHIEIVGRLIRVWVQHNNKNAIDIGKAISSIKMKLEYSGAPTSLDQLSRNSVCFAKYTDNEYYRCIVLSGNSSAKLSVAFIDYGNIQVVNMSDMRALTSEIKTQLPELSYPGQATSYYLHSVALLRAMTEEDYEWLKNLTVNFEFQCCIHEGLYGTRTISILIEDNVELSNLLVQKNLAKLINREELETLVKELIQFSTNAASFNVNANFNQQARFQQSPVSKIEVVAPAAPPQTVTRKPTLPLYQPPPVYQHMMNQQPANSQQRFVVPKEKLVTAGPYISQPSAKKKIDNSVSVGSAYQMYVSHVTDGPLQFSLQLKNYADEFLPYLSSQMNSLPPQKFTSVLTIGMIVMAMHPPDKALRRAVVTSTASNTCKVFYIDLGSSEDLPFSNIFQLPPSLNTDHFPAVAYNFALKGIDGSMVTDAMKAGFQQLVMSKVVFVKVMTEGPVRTCDLFVDGRDIKILLASFNQPLQYLRQFPPREKDIPVCVSYVEGPQQIFVQYKSEMATLLAIEKTLASQYSLQREIININDLTIGKPVLSLYSSDNQWYRAQIMEISPNQTITVLYVDYGNKEYVNPSTLREISSDLVSKWRCQAVECCLVGFDSILPSESLAEKLEQKILSAEVTLRVHSLLSADRLLVDLIDSSGCSIAAYTSEIYNTSLAEAQLMNEPPPVTTKDSAVQSQIMIESSPEKEVLDYSDKYFRAAGFSNSPKLKDTNEDSSFKKKPKDHGDTSTTNKFKIKDNEASHGKQWRKDTEESSFGGNKWKSRDAYEDGRKRNDDGDNFKKNDKWNDSAKYGKGKDDSVKMKSGRNSDDARPKYNKDERFHVNAGRKTDERSERKDQNWKSRDSDYKPKDSDWKSRDSDFKPKDSDWKTKDSDYKSKNSEWKSRDSDWKSKDSDWKSKDSDWKLKDSDWKSKDSDWKSKDSDWKSKDSDWKDYKPRHSEYKTKESSHRKWDDDCRKGRGEFKWKDSKSNEPYDSKKTSKTLYSDSADKNYRTSSTKSEELPTAATATDTKFNPKVKEYSPWQLEGKSSYTVTLAHVDSPGRFFVRPVEADVQLDKLRDMIDMDSYSKSRTVPAKAIAVGMPVLAVYSEDGQLYRAVVEKIGSKTVDVLFVDYGNRSEILLTELYYPLDNLARLPMTVVRCSMSYIKPVGGSWSTDDEATLECFGEETQFFMTVDGVKLVDGLPVNNVSLLCPRSGKSVAQALVDAGIAKFSSGKGSSPALVTQESVEPIAALAPPLTEETASEEEWVERLDLLVGQFLICTVVSIVSNDTVIVKLDAVKLVVCVSHDSSAVQIGDKVIIHVNCILEDRLRVTIYDKSGCVAGDVKKERLKISPVCRMPIIRSRFRVQVPHCENSCIYVQKVADSDRIAEILDSLFSFYDGTKPSGKEFAVDSLCAAKSSDGNWYRARVIRRDRNYTVKFIDYGNTEEIDSSQIRKLDSRFFFPELAFEAKVHLKWRVPEHEIDLMRYVDGKEFTASFIKHNSDDWFISLEDNDSKKLFDTIIQAGLAENYKENPFYESNSVIGNDIVAGDKIPVTVTHVESPETFWVQMVKHVQAVESLKEKLQDYSETKKDSNCGIFAAKYSADDVWYRALAIDPNNPDSVRFIDYGNTDIVTERKELSHFLTKPRSGYAIKMCLCVAPIDDNWSREALDTFEEFIDADQIIAEIVTVTYKIVTDLSVDGKSLSKLLIDNNLAVYQDFTPPLIKNYLSVIDSQVSTVFICHTVSVNDFYTLDKNRETELEEFTSSLLELEPFSPVPNPKVGDLVVAKFPEDDSWYRAKIVRLNPLQVHFIDFGNFSEATEIGAIPKELRDTPPFAVHCSLDVEESDLVLDKFLELSDEGKNPFSLSLVLKGDPNIVKLSLNDTDICDLLPKVQSRTVSIDGQIGYVSHFNSLDDFYLQLQDDIKLDNVIDELSQAENFGNVDKMCNGSLVAALYSCDLQWYRAKIISSEPLTVLFYDYGNTAKVSRVKELPPDLKLIPALAHRCSYRKPSGIDEWTPAITDSFLEVSHKGNTPFTIKLIKSGNPNIVTLVNDTDREVISSLNCSKNISTSEGCDTTQKDVSSVTSKLENIDLGCETDNTGDKFNSSAYKLNDNFVTISHYESVDDFYVISNDDKLIFDRISRKLSNMSRPTENADFPVGDTVAALLAETGEWNRAKILSNNPLEVLFIDIGLIAHVNSMRKLPDEFNVNSIKPLAFRCHLKKPDGCSNWPDTVDLLSDFMALCTDELKIKVHSTGESNSVSLFLNDKNIISKLGLLYSDDKENSNIILQTPSLYNNKTVRISHADSLNSFYVRKDGDSSKLKEISEVLSRSPFQGAKTLKKGDLVCAKSTDDGMWYRALVLATEPVINVKFIDNGNSSDVSDVKELPASLKEVPSLSLHCRLDLPRGLTSWNSEAEEKFKGLSSDILIEYVFKAVEPGDPCSVRLINNGKDLSVTLAGDLPDDKENSSRKSSSTEPNMNNKLAILSHVNSLDEFYIQLLDDADKVTDVILKLMDVDDLEDVKEARDGLLVAAEFTDMQWHRAKILNSTDQGINVFFIDYGNTSVVTNIKELTQDLKDIPALAYQLKLKKPEGVAEWTDQMEKQFTLFKDLNNNRPLVVLSHSSGCVSLMLNDVNIFNKFTTLSLDRVNQEAAFVTYCESPSNFYVQFNSTLELQAKVFEGVSRAEDFSDARNLKVGDLVCVNYPNDGLWYRSKVLKTEPDLVVSFIDYGSTVTVDSTPKVLPDDLKAIEPLAKHCSLVPPRCGSGWSEEARSYFLVMTSSPLTINIIERVDGKPLTIDLFIDGNSVTSDLLELCPVVERSPETEESRDELDLDDDDIMREEALFNAEENVRRAEGNDPKNPLVCNGISDLSVDEKDESVRTEGPAADEEKTTAEAPVDEKSTETTGPNDPSTATDENKTSEAVTESEKPEDKPVESSVDDTSKPDSRMSLDEIPIPGTISRGEIQPETSSLPKTDDKILPGAVRGTVSPDD